MKRILFISHDASRTGAPVVLLNLMRWLKKNSSIDFDILLLKDGPLKKDFEEIAKTYFIPFEYKYSLLNKVRRRLHPELLEEYKIEEVVRKLGKRKYDLVYGNTVVSLPWLLKFKKAIKVKTVCAMHELSFVIDFYFTKEYLFEASKNLDLVIAGSRAVSDNLVAEYKISKEKIEVVHAFIDQEFTLLKDRATLRHELGLKDDELVIGAMGSADLRKGIDLFIPLAVKLKNKYPGVLFKLVWVGGRQTDLFIKLIKQDAKKCGVEDRVLFIENTQHPDDYINFLDVFVLLSREDPFPLVLLSAAGMQKAIIAFDNSGGAPELLNEGAGFISPYLDVDDVAKTISSLYYDRGLMNTTGEKAKQKVEKEFSSEVIPAKVLKLLQEL